MFGAQALQDLDRRAQLSRLMLHWRQRLVPLDFPELVQTGRVRPYGYLSQEDMAYLTGVSVKWYGALERGRLHHNYSEEFLDRVAESLRLDSGERRILFWLARQQEPPSQPGRVAVHAARPSVTAAVRAALASQPWPAFVCDSAWEILAANDATDRWFADLTVEGNLMRWLFCRPTAPLQIDDWESVARVMLNQLTAQAARLPDHDGVKTVLRAILDSSATARLWWQREPGVWLYDDGNRWSIRLPSAPQPTKVEICSSTPLRDSDLRTYATVPLSGHVPDECAGLMASMWKAATSASIAHIAARPTSSQSR